MRMSVKLAEGILSDLMPAPLKWREVVGGGAYVANRASLGMIFEVWGTTGTTKVDIETWYAASGRDRPLLESQLSADGMACNSFSESQTVQNWCILRIEATVATDATSPKTSVQRPCPFGERLDGHLGEIGGRLNLASSRWAGLQRR
jgi:hypothetical protein